MIKISELSHKQLVQLAAYFMQLACAYNQDVMEKLDNKDAISNIAGLRQSFAKDFIGNSYKIVARLDCSELGNIRDVLEKGMSALRESDSDDVEFAKVIDESIIEWEQDGEK